MSNHERWGPSTWKIWSEFANDPEPTLLELDVTLKHQVINTDYPSTAEINKRCAQKVTKKRRNNDDCKLDGTYWQICKIKK